MSPLNQVFPPEALHSPKGLPVFFSRKHIQLAYAFVALILITLPVRSTERIRFYVQGDLESQHRAPSPAETTASDKGIRSTALLIRSALAQEEDRPELAFKTLHSAWSLSPANPPLAVRLAYETLEKEDVKSAQSILSETARLCPSDGGVRIHQAIIGLRYESNPRLALGYAEEAYKLSPSNPRAIGVLTESLASLGNFARIEQLLTACAALQTQDQDFWSTTSETFAKNLFVQGELPHPHILAKFNTLLKRSISAGIQDPEHLEKNADLCVLSSQLPEATRLYRHSLSLPDSRPTQRRALAHHKLARTLLALDQDQEALDAASQAIALDSSNPSHLELRADIHFERKNLPLALSDLAKSAALDPEALELQLRTASLEIKLHEFAAAAKRCQQIGEIFPSAPTPKILNAIALASTGKAADAILQLEAAESLLTNSEQASIGPEILFPLGVAAERAGLTEKAESLLRKCIDSDSEFAAEAANHLAFMWIDSNQNLDEAGQLVRRAIQSRPENPHFRDTFGWWLHKTGQTRNAITELLKALRTMPSTDRADVHHHLAESYMSLGDAPNAAHHFKAESELRPDQPGILETIENLRINHPELR